MIIDFHTHIFPEKIAEKTINALSEKGGIPAHADGTAVGLVSAMKTAGVDVSITLPVLTNPLSFENVNRFAAEINSFFANKSCRLISFGAIHPACDDIDKKMRELKEQGFLGVKIHPDYQGTYINDSGYVKIMQSAAEYDLTVITHAGVDIAFPNDVHCTAQGAKELIRKAPNTKFVLAHFGGVDMMHDFMEEFTDEAVYFDTAYVLPFIKKSDFDKLLSAYGDDRILFGSDSPWNDVRRDVEALKSFSLEKNTELKLFEKNARKLLGI